MALTLLQWLLQGVPECLALAALATVLAGQKLEARKVLPLGLVQALAALLVRRLPLAFGLHFIVLIVVLAALLNLLLKVALSRSLFTALVAMIALAAAETAFVAAIHRLAGIPFAEVRQDLWLWVMHGWPHILFLFLCALALEKGRKGRQGKGEKL